MSDHDEISAASLAICCQDGIYVSPPMLAGVPFEKIDETHDYWDPSWPILECLIQSRLNCYEKKLERLRRTSGLARHHVFFANRQVNRGHFILDFLKRENTFHPYQLVKKEMMAELHTSFSNYDTMFRLLSAHEELKRFDMDVTPLDWLRQRIHEISTSQGDSFDLCKSIRGLYHDDKIRALRKKHGLSNIGRPSGANRLPDES